MSIKIFKDRETLKNNLRDRNLIFNESELDDVLKKYNYFNFFNGLETIYLHTSNPKSYQNVTLDDFKNLYFFDKQLRFTLTFYLDALEEKLKSSISYHFAKHNCSSLADTMQYTNPHNYMNPSDSDPLSPTYCPYSSRYPFIRYQNKNVCTTFDNFMLFNPKFLTNLIRQKDHIDSSFYQDTSYVAPANVAVYENYDHTLNRHIAVPFWVTIETLTFGNIRILLNYLKDDVMTDVLKDFDLALSKRAAFLNMIDILLCLRNACAHTTLVNRFRTPKLYHINSLLISVFSLSPKNSNSVLSLFDTIKILSYFVDISDLKKPFRQLKIQTYKSFGLKDGKQVFSKILDRMGCSKYNEWKKLFNNPEYSL